MSHLRFEDFELLEESGRTEAFSASDARRLRSSAPLRLVLFSSEVSQSPEFRAAFRKDEPNLTTSNHENIPGLIGWGEHEGRLFYVTREAEGRPLSELFAAGRRLALDELTDIAWQISSALQFAHNIGLCHGGLSVQTVLVSDELRVALPEFCVHHWVAAATGKQHQSFAALSREDLQALGQLLRHATSFLSEDSTASVPKDWNELLSDLEKPSPDLMAREVQGRLGDMLLNDGGDSIEMLDHREGLHLSRRSIVDELFDEPPRQPIAPTASAAVADHERGKRWLIVILAAIAIFPAAVGHSAITATQFHLPQGV